MAITLEIATLAAEWWADQVCAPKFDGPSPEERQSGENQAYKMAEMLANIATQPVQDEQRKQFINNLAERIVEKQPHSLYVDYGPDQLLGEAGEAAGIPGTNWPWKTGCYFRDGEVWVSSGYGSESRKLEE